MLDSLFFRRRRHPVGEEELSAYIDEQSAPEARARLEAHIESCAPCREQLAELRMLREALRELPRAPAPRAFALRETDVRSTEQRRPLGVLGRAQPLLSGVAVAAILVFGVLVGFDLLGGPSADEQGVDGSAAQMRLADEGGPASADAPDIKGTPEAPADALPGAPFDESATVPLPATGGDQEQFEGYDATVANEADAGLTDATPPPLPATGGPTELEEPEGGGWTRLRTAEAAAAAVALIAGGSVALVWWRRRV